MIGVPLGNELEMKGFRVLLRYDVVVVEFSSLPSPNLRPGTFST
jgi:hypothetical protein